MLKICSWTVALALAGLAWSAAPAKKKAPVTTTAPKATARKAPAKSVGRKTAPRTTWRNRQMVPSPERHKEIQEALAAKGYMRPEDATGAWNKASIDALKGFQTSQNIAATGKINSLSLIALGLGPKREPVTTDKPPAPPADPNGSR